MDSQYILVDKSPHKTDIYRVLFNIDQFVLYCYHTRHKADFNVLFVTDMRHTMTDRRTLYKQLAEHTKRLQCHQNGGVYDSETNPKL
jgi:hypothetical protein